MGLRRFIFASLAVYSLVSTVVSADTRPEIPAAGEDTALFGGRSAREFFDERARNTACRERLAVLHARFRTLRRELLALLASGGTAAALDAKERETDAARLELAGPMERCGDCATNPVQRRHVTGAGGREVWYVADGSCLTGGTNYAAARQTVRQSPLHIRRRGGFPALLDFVVVDGESGDLRPQVTSLETSPMNAFVAMRGTKILGTMLAFAQYFRIDWLDTPATGTPSSTYVTFRSERPPREFVEPPVQERTAGGTAVPTTLLSAGRMGAVNVMWYLTANGYLRYYCAGDFRADVPFLDAEGRRILMDSVIEMAERYAN